MPMQDDDHYIFKPATETMNQIVVWIPLLTRIKMMIVTTKHYIRSQKEIQMMRKRKSNMILINNLKNKWIFIKMDQKTPLVKR